MCKCVRVCVYVCLKVVVCEQEMEQQKMEGVGGGGRASEKVK